MVQSLIVVSRLDRRGQSTWSVVRRCWREAPRCVEPSAARSPIVFDDFIRLAFQRGIGATLGRASQTVTQRTQTFEHRGIALSPAPVWYARAGVTDCDAEKLWSPVLARGAAVCGAECSALADRL